MTFADIIKFVTMFIKIIFKDSKNVKGIRNYESRCNLYLYFFMQQNLPTSGKKMKLIAVNTISIILIIWILLNTNISNIRVFSFIGLFSCKGRLRKWVGNSKICWRHLTILKTSNKNVRKNYFLICKSIYILKVYSIHYIMR